MQAEKQCKKCIKSLTIKTLELSSPLKSKQENCALADKLTANFRLTRVPAKIFTGINRKIKNFSKTKDPFRQIKEREMLLARRVAKKIRPPSSAGLNTLLLFSAKGNTLDFFKDIEFSLNQMQEKSVLEIAHIREFRKKLKRSKRVLFFADNAGEIFFDLPLINYLSRTVEVSYVVKAAPVQNDMTIREARISGLYKRFPRIISSGNDAVGIELETASKLLLRELNRSDIILAKGMGYYETFTELPRFEGKIFHLLMAKCLPVARSLGVKKESYVFIGR